MSFIQNDLNLLKKLLNIAEKKNFLKTAENVGAEVQFDESKYGVATQPIFGKKLQDGTEMPAFPQQLYVKENIMYDNTGNPIQSVQQLSNYFDYLERIGQDVRTNPRYQPYVSVVDNFKNYQKAYNRQEKAYKIRVGEAPAEAAVDAQAITHRQLEKSYKLANIYVVNLQRALGDPQAPKKVSAPIDIEGRKNNTTLPPATTKDFRTLTDFCNWLATNKITWKGKRIAYLSSDKDKNFFQNEKMLPFKGYPPDRAQRLPDNQTENFEIYAQPEFLKKYLEYLRDYLSPTLKNITFNVMLRKLIEEYNIKVGRLSGTSISSSSGVDPSELNLPNNLLVDGFTSDTFDESNPLDGVNQAPLFANSPFKLYAGALKNESEFRKWFDSFKLKTKDGTTKPLKDPDSNQCIAINALYQRANFLKNNFKSLRNPPTGYETAINLYLKNIEKFGKNLMFQGKNCNVTNTGSGGVEVTTGPAGAGTGAPGAGTGAGTTGATGALPPGQVDKKTSEAVIELTKYFPLTLGAVNIQSIEVFLNQVFSSGLNIANMATQPQTILKEKIRSVMKPGENFVNLNTGLEGVVGVLKNPQQDLCSFLRNLQDVIRQIASIISYFFKTYYNVIKNNAQAYNECLAQVGLGENTSYSIFYRNINQISEIIARYPPCFNVTK